MAPEHDDFDTITKQLSGERTGGGLHYRLQIVYPEGVLAEIRLGTERVVIGRKPDESAMPRLIHSTVSRSHVELIWNVDRQEHRIKDLESHNGTRFDGAPLGDQWRSLHDGAVIQLGDVLAVYENHPGLLEPERNDVSHEDVPGHAAATRSLRSRIARAADDPSPALLIGETGTGKEWLAREIHRLSQRPGPLVAVNCSALNELIIESQLFGHVRGAFTGASADHRGVFRDADGGTLFLDEIGELPLKLQPKLLRALQEGQVQPIGSSETIAVDVRIVAATNRPLHKMVERNEFRRDLYARLALWQIELPALRHRRADLLMWFDRLHRRWTEQRDEKNPSALKLSPSAAEALVLYDWKDNLRGMDRLIHELASRTDLDGGLISQDDLPTWLLESRGAPLQSSPNPPAEPTGALSEAEDDSATSPRPPKPNREEFIAAYEKFTGSVHALARHYRRDRRQIYRWIALYDLNDTRNSGA